MPNSALKKNYLLLLLTLFFILSAGLILFSFTPVKAQGRLPEITFTLNGQQGSITVPPGSNVSGGYFTQYATSCYGEGQWGVGPRPLSGTVNIANIQASTIYRLWCGNSTGIVYSEFIVTVSSQPPPPPNTPWVDLRVNGGDRAYIQSGGTVTLTWTSNMVTSCVASQSWGGVRPTSGQAGIGGILTSRNYKLTCTGSSGTVEDQVSVIVNPPAPPPPGAFPTPTPAATAAPTPQPTAPAGTCTLLLSPSSLSARVGQQGFFVANVSTPSGGTIDRVEFRSSNSNVLSVTSPDTSFPYRSTYQATAVGNAVVVATAFMNGVASCTGQVTVPVTSAIAWWQVKNANVTTNGDLISYIPPSCILPDCEPSFILDGSGGYPGIAVYSGTEADFSDETGNDGTVSSKGWLANTTYLGPTYNFDYFNYFLSSNLIFNPVGRNINSGTLTSGTPAQGYYWYNATGDVTINGPITIPAGRKVILLVESGDLIINNTIHLASEGENFFLAIVQGNIEIDSRVSSVGRPALEGLFVADGTFQSGAGNQPLWVRGSVTAWGGFSLERDLGSENSDTPAEVFEYNPNLMFYFPPLLRKNSVIWQEVAP